MVSASFGIMNRQTTCKPSAINVSVIGFPGINSGTREHVGKSCLINRFLSHLPYCENHISVVSLSDFDGEVICGSHWLYWGEGKVTIGENVSHLKIVEQCDFVDDHLFSPISVNSPYIDRCLNTDLMAPSRKLAYVCKDQLGHEEAFPRAYLEPGSFHIGVFVCVYDMTLSGPSAFQQASFLQQVLLHLSSSKIPAVLATSKHDGEITQAATNLLENVLKSIKKRWIRRHFCIVETSARYDININKVFQCAYSLATSKTNDKSRANAIQLFRLLRTADTSKSLSERLKCSVDSKLQYFYYEPPKSVPANSQVTRSAPTGVLGVSPYSCCSPDYGTSHLCQKSDLDSKYPLISLLPNLCLSNHPSPILQQNSTRPSSALAQTPHPTFQSRCPSNLVVKSGDPCEGSVLPTPPPLLLTGPRSPGSFGPVNYPSFFGSPKSMPETSTQPIPTSGPTSVDKALAFLYVHGSIETVEAITKALTQSCPFNRYHTRLGHQYQVWILSGSKLDKQKVTPTSASAANIPTPSSPTNKRPDFLSIRPCQTNLNKSQLSAFSAPSPSPVESSPDYPSPIRNNGVPTTTSSPTIPKSDGIPNGSICLVNEVRNGDCASKLGSTNDLPQLCIHISTYSSAVELQNSMSFLDSLDSNSGLDDTGRSGNCKVIKVLVYWCLSPSAADMVELMLRGIHLTCRTQIPLIVVDQKSSSCLLSHVLDLASTRSLIQSSESPLIVCDQLESPIDLTCLLPNVVQQLTFELVVSSNPYFIQNNFHFNGILASLILHDRYPSWTDVDQSLSPQSHSTTNRLFFLSPTVAVPTAIRIRPPCTNLAVHHCNSCFGPRFVQLEQALKLLQNHLSSGDCTAPSNYYNILVIHCNASQWTGQQKTVLDAIETVLTSCSSSTKHNRACQSSCLIMLVILNSNEQSTDADFKTQTMQRLSAILRTHGTSLFVPPTSVLPITDTSLISERSSTDSRKPNSTLPAIPSELSDNGQTLFESTPKALFAVLFLSALDPASRNLYRRILEGDFEGWYSTDKFTSPVVTSSTTPMATESNRSNQQQVPNSTKPSPKSNSNFVQRQTTLTPYPKATSTELKSGMVELPWLPLNPLDALRIPGSDRDHCQISTGCSYPNSNDYPVVSTLDKNRIPAVPSSSGFWTDSYHTLSRSFNDPQTVYPGPTRTNHSHTARRSSVSMATESCSANSSVEEYYAELPKITQPNVFKLEYHRPHPDRPKRPLPRTASVNSHSSQSSSPLPERLNHSTPNSVDHHIPSVHYSDCDFDKPSKPDSSHSSTHSPHCSNNMVDQNREDVSAVYAEVNDALVYKEPNEFCPPQLPPPRTNSFPIPPISLFYHLDPASTDLNVATSIRDPVICTTQLPRAASAVRRNSPLFVQNNGSTKSCKARFFKSDSPQLVHPSQPDSNGIHPPHSYDGHPNLSGLCYPPPVQPAPPPPFGFPSLRPLSVKSNFPNPCQPPSTICGHHSPSVMDTSSNAYHVSDVPANSDSTIRCATTTAAPAPCISSHGNGVSSWNFHQSEKDPTLTTFQTLSPAYCDNKQPKSSDSNTNSSTSIPSQPNHSISSTLDSLTAAFKRHGVWLRQSTTSRRSRKTKA